MTAAVRCRVLGSDRGVALIMSLLATTMLAAIGIGLVTMSTTERAVAGNARESLDGLYAAEAIVERVVVEIRDMPQWNDVVSVLTRSSFVDASTTPITPGGPIDLFAATAALQRRSDDEGLWGANNAVWRLFAYGSLEAMVGAGSIGTSSYVVAWIADDPTELDGDPARDSNEVLLVRGRAVGRGGLARDVQVTLKRAEPYSSGRSAGLAVGALATVPPQRPLARILPDPTKDVGSRQGTNPGVQILSWREMR